MPTAKKQKAARRDDERGFVDSVREYLQEEGGFLACVQSEVRLYAEETATHGPATPVFYIVGLYPAPKAASVARIARVVFKTVSGLSEMLSIPCSTRNCANSG